MNAVQYIENWMGCLHFFGKESFSGDFHSPETIEILGLSANPVLDAVIKCIPSKKFTLTRGDNIYGDLLGGDAIVKMWLTEELAEGGLVPIFSCLSGDFLLVSINTENSYKCLWLHNRYFHHQEEGLKKHLSDWVGYPWEVIRRIERKGKFYWDDVFIESWSDI